MVLACEKHHHMMYSTSEHDYLKLSHSLSASQRAVVHDYTQLATCLLCADS